MRFVYVVVTLVAACTGDDSGGGDDGGGGGGGGGGGSQMLTFGADLTATPNVTSVCSQAAQSSCTLYSGAPGPSFYAPVSGTVTKVRVKTAPGPTGPMQVVVMRSLYQNKVGDPGHPYFACCFVEAYGPVFTPNAGTITEVTTSLPMVADPTPPADDFVTNARGDFLALSILAPNVAIPAMTDTTNSLWYLYAPAPSPQTVPAPSANVLTTGNNSGFGIHLMVNADITF